MRPDLPADLVDKPTRLPATGAVRLVVVAERGVVVADVTGETGHRTVTRNASRGWSCTCPAWAFRGDCTHVDAVGLVVHPLPVDNRNGQRPTVTTGGAAA